MSGAVPTRRSIKLQKLVRLPSKTTGNGESTTTYAGGASCPNSPAVKKSYRMVVVGSAQAGKSAIVSRFLGNAAFEDRYLPTIENFHRKLYKIRGDLYELDILDRSGNDPFPAARKLSYITGDIFVIVGAVDNAGSVDQMLEIYQQIYECKMSRACNISKPKMNGIGCVAVSSSSSSISSVGGAAGGAGTSSSSSSAALLPVVFVLNKIDLPFHKWQVGTVDEVRERVAQILPTGPHADCFVACSAASDENISRIFARLFTIGKLPKYMNPEVRRTLRNELSADRVTESSAFFGGGAVSTAINGESALKRPVLQRMRSKFSRDSDDEVIIDVNARRPSLRTDLLLNRTKSAAALYQNTATVFDINGKKASKQQQSYTYKNNESGGDKQHKNCIIS